MVTVAQKWVETLVGAEQTTLPGAAAAGRDVGPPLACTPLCSLRGGPQREVSALQKCSSCPCCACIYHDIKAKTISRVNTVNTLTLLSLHLGVLRVRSRACLLRSSRPPGRSLQRVLLGPQLSDQEAVQSVEPLEASVEEPAQGVYSVLGDRQGVAGGDAV